jgi:hypothetical protein
MKNIFLLFLIVTSIDFIILLILDKIQSNKSLKYKKALLKGNDEDEIKLMIGYNYISNLNKLDSIANEFTKSNIDSTKLEYMEKIIETTNRHIYDDEVKEMTTYYENEFLYKNKIINLDIVFYGFKALFNMYKENKYKGINIDNNEEFMKKLDKLNRKSNKIVKRKKDRAYYYDNIEKMKIEYKSLIDEENAENVLSFVKNAINDLNKTS